MLTQKTNSRVAFVVCFAFTLPHPPNYGRLGCFWKSVGRKPDRLALDGDDGVRSNGYSSRIVLLQLMNATWPSLPSLLIIY